jgi:hypothetical protein
MWHRINVAPPPREEMLQALLCMKRPDGIHGLYAVSRCPLLVRDPDSCAVLVIFNSVN